MRKNSHGRILKGKPKEQHSSLYLSHALKKCKLKVQYAIYSYIKKNN